MTVGENLRLGAYTHLSKPFDTEQFRQVVARALERKRMTTSSTPAQKEFPLLDIVGFSPSINAVTPMATPPQPGTDVTVLARSIVSRMKERSSIARSWSGIGW